MRIMLFIWILVSAGTAGDARGEAPGNPCDTLYRQGELRASISCYEQLAESSLEYRIGLVRSWNDLATEEASLADREKAFRTAEYATKLAQDVVADYPGSAEAWLYYAAASGNMALFAGSREKVRLGHSVEAYCFRALELDPDFALPHIVLGVYYREIAELGPILRSLARLLYGSLPQNSHDKALHHLALAVSIAPELRVAWYQLGRTQEAFDLPEAALSSYSASLLTEPVNARDIRNGIHATARIQALSGSTH